MIRRATGEVNGSPPIELGDEDARTSINCHRAQRAVQTAILTSSGDTLLQFVRRFGNGLRDDRQAAGGGQALFQLADQRLGQHVLDIVGIAVDVIAGDAGAFDQEQFPQAVRARDFGRGGEAGRRESHAAVVAFDQALRLRVARATS